MAGRRDECRRCLRDMDFTRLGSSGLVVSRLGLGCNNFAYNRLSKADSIPVLRGAVDAGVTLFDTSDSYGDSEVAVGEALEGHRDEVVIATKFGSRPQGRARSRLGSPRCAPLHPQGRRTLVAAVAHRPHRPVPAPPAGPADPDPGDPGRAHRAGPGGQGPLHRVVELRRLAGVRCRVDGPQPRPRAVHQRAEQLQPARARARGGRRPGMRGVRDRHPAVLPARQRTADREVHARASRLRREPGTASGACRPATPSSTSSRSCRASPPNAVSSCSTSRWVAWRRSRRWRR